MELNERQSALCAQNDTDFSDLSAVFFNCTLKHPDQPSHTSLLMGASAEIMRRNSVAVDDIRGTAHRIAFGVQPDMREHGWEHDDWPDLWQRIEAADILVIGTPIWLDDSIRAAASLLLNTGVAYRRDRFELRIDVFNLLDSDDNDIAYFYASRLLGEAPGGVDDLHFHPLEPRTARLGIAWYWR